MKGNAALLDAMGPAAEEIHAMMIAAAGVDVAGRNVAAGRNVRVTAGHVLSRTPSRRHVVRLWHTSRRHVAQ